MESFGSASENSSEKLLYKTTKNLQYIMKFIIRSRILFAKMNDDRDQAMFEASLEGLCANFCPFDQYDQLNLFTFFDRFTAIFY